VQVAQECEGCAEPEAQQVAIASTCLCRLPVKYIRQLEAFADKHNKNIDLFRDTPKDI